MATQAESLKLLIDGVHIGVRYLCDQCDYAAITAGCLKKHIEINMKVSDIPVTCVNTLPL